MKSMKEGFSLVEVIVAIAVLALLSLPILAYFSDASVFTSRGKHTQKATTAGQAVAEEVNNCDDFEEVEDVLSTQAGWTLDSKAAGSDHKSHLTKEVTEDGEKFKVKVTVDYEYSRVNSAGDTTDSKFNEFETPQLKEIYSPKNVVLSETDQADVAVSHFLADHPDKAQSEIKTNMTRVIWIQLGVDTSNSDVYTVKCFYRYSYEGADFDSVLNDTKIEKSKLENIYLFYNITKDTGAEEVKVDCDPSILATEAEKVNVYMICQKKVMAPTSGYSLSISVTGTAQRMNYYTNGINCTGITAKTDFIEKQASGKRIAAVSVDVYPESATVFNDDTRVVHLDTSKGER